MQGIPLFQAIDELMDKTCWAITSTLTPFRFLMNNISTLWNLKWWESQSNNDEEIKIVCTYEWLSKPCNGFPWFRPYIHQYETFPHREPNRLPKKTLEWIKYKLCGTWNDEKVH